MAEYVPITDDEIVPEAPLTTSLVFRLRDNALAYLGAPIGTRGIFPQASAPLGWVIDAALSNRALRIAPTGGGSIAGVVGFTTVFGTTAVGDRSLAISQMPAHDHDMDTTNGFASGQPLRYRRENGGSIAGNETGNTGGGGSHDHALDLRVQYLNAHVAVKQ